MSKPPKGFKTQREYAEHLKKEAAIEKAQERWSDKEAVLEATYGESEKAENTKANNSNDKSDWEYLRSVAKAQFPEGAEHLNLSPKNRLAAIASCLGWSQSKIGRATGLNQRTIGKWLKRPDIILFMNEFNMKRGSEGSDVMTKFTELEYKAVQCVDKILSDPDTSDPAKRLKLDASKWVFERNRGKPNQPVEHRGADIKKLIQTMSEIGPGLKLSEEEEKDLFDEIH